MASWQKKYIKILPYVRQSIGICWASFRKNADNFDKSLPGIIERFYRAISGSIQKYSASLCDEVQHQSIWIAA